MIKNIISNEPSKSTYFVIMLGLARLTAARQLILFGFEVTILEVQKSACGRVNTKKMMD